MDPPSFEDEAAKLWLKSEQFFAQKKSCLASIHLQNQVQALNTLDQQLLPSQSKREISQSVQIIQEPKIAKECFTT